MPSLALVVCLPHTCCGDRTYLRENDTTFIVLAFITASPPLMSLSRGSLQYHNNVHGADVLHGVNALLNTTVLNESFSDMEVRVTLAASHVLQRLLRYPELHTPPVSVPHRYSSATALFSHAYSSMLASPQVLSALIAAAVHDANHPGRSSAFVIKTRHPLAILYNDMSVLENHHASTVGSTK